MLNQVITNSGQSLNMKGGADGELFASLLRLPGYAATKLQRRFTIANAVASPTITTVGVATTYTGLALINPLGSGVDAVIGDVGITTIVTQPTQINAWGIAIGQSGIACTNTTPVTPVNAFAGGNAGKVLGSVAATLGVAPVVTKWLATSGFATQGPNFDQGVFPQNGNIIIPPGGFLIIASKYISAAASFLGSIEYEEVPA